ncbi:MAG: hypothetical protein RBR42_10720 [Desulfomicrobium sp.]|nr:hypothetical protein [Desulfomicrobium sp.]NLV97602.1 hypothetical protein [Desulfovibrionales bacterium]
MIFVITQCTDCPFLHLVDGQKTCNVALPKGRPITPDVDRPVWCKLRKEQIIVRDFK